MMPSVLYVEDTETMQNIYGFALKKEGFDVTIVGTAGEALARIEDFTYDIVLVDMMLSGMSGLDFLSQAKITDKHPSTKIIALSNVDSPNIIDKAKAFGVTEYLVKAQYEPPQLATHLKEVLNSTHK